MARSWDRPDLPARRVNGRSDGRFGYSLRETLGAQCEKESHRCRPASLDAPQGVRAAQQFPEFADNQAGRRLFGLDRPPGHPAAGPHERDVRHGQAETVDDDSPRVGSKAGSSPSVMFAIVTLSLSGRPSLSCCTASRTQAGGVRGGAASGAMPDPTGFAGFPSARLRGSKSFLRAAPVCRCRSGVLLAACHVQHHDALVGDPLPDLQGGAEGRRLAEVDVQPGTAVFHSHYGRTRLPPRSFPRAMMSVPSASTFFSVRSA